MTNGTLPELDGGYQRPARSADEDENLARAGLEAGLGEVASEATAGGRESASVRVALGVRVYDDHIEVEVVVLPVEASLGRAREAFGPWLAGILRAEGLSQEAADRAHRRVAEDREPVDPRPQRTASARTPARHRCLR